MKNILVSAVAAAAFSCVSLADECHKQARPDGHAPLGVMADHFHKKGGWMASVRAMGMAMGDPANAAMGPQSMDMRMVMASLMYAPSDHLTLAAMIGYNDKSMDMIMMGMENEMEADGVSDLKLNAIVPLWKGESKRLHVTLGGVIPTGKTGSKNTMAARLPLTMQAGTGSWAVAPSLTYSQFEDGWSFGGQIGGTFRLDHNSYGEKAGDQWMATGWTSLVVSDSISLSVRATYEDKQAWKNVPVILGDARQTLWLAGGANYLASSGHRLALEVGFPIWQDQHGNNLQNGVSAMLGWQKAF